MPEILESDLGKGWWTQRTWWIPRQDTFKETKVVCVNNEQGWGAVEDRNKRKISLQTAGGLLEKVYSMEDALCFLCSVTLSSLKLPQTFGYKAETI